MPNRPADPLGGRNSLGLVTDVEDLLAFLEAAPSPYHAVAEASRRLQAAGFAAMDATEEWPSGSGRFFLASGGALVAWSVPASAAADAATPFRIVGAHTDSPNLRIRPRPDTASQGWRQLAVEVYGGALWNSWLDRDLGLSGRVVVDAQAEPLLVRVERPLLRIPQLAIHLDREVNSGGLDLNPQRHLTPVWGVGPVQEGDFVEFLAEAVSAEHGQAIDPADIGAWDLMVHDLATPVRLGRRRELVASARLDDLLSCWAAVEALVAGDDEALEVVAVACLYDHEEVGSTSATGADGALLAQVLERTVLARGGHRDHYLRALAASSCASTDGAHATHPNYPERHEPGHPVSVDGGPVIKVNANQRYATEAMTATAMAAACERAGVPHQWFVSRNDQPCGSTIGPVTASRLAVPTVDVGVAMLSMHSARELCGAEDPVRFAQMLSAWLAAPRA